MLSETSTKRFMYEIWIGFHLSEKIYKKVYNAKYNEWIIYSVFDFHKDNLTNGNVYTNGIFNIFQTNLRKVLFFLFSNYLVIVYFSLDRKD